MKNFIAKNPLSLNDKTVDMKNLLQEEIDLRKWLKPESDLEEKLLKDPDFIKGLFWGKPRFGHPEGKVIFHIAEVLENVDKVNADPKVRTNLRLITFIHDTFKYLEDKSSYPRDWSKHHAVFARKFAEKYLTEKYLLDIIELHDEAYYAWRLEKLYNKPTESKTRLSKLLSKIEPHVQLYYLFFKCDTQTGDKIQASVKWFEENVPVEIVNF